MKGGKLGYFKNSPQWSSIVSMEVAESCGCAKIEKLISEGLRSPWGDGSQRVELLRTAYIKFTHLVSQILDVPEAQKLLVKIRQGYRRTTTAKVPIECSRGRSLQSALGRLDALQHALASYISSHAESIFDARVHQLVQCVNGSGSGSPVNSSDESAESTASVVGLRSNEMIQTVEFLVTLLSFLGHLSIGSTRTADMVKNFVPTPLISSLLRLSQSCCWHSSEDESSKDMNNALCGGLGVKCRAVKQGVYQFLLRVHLQPQTGCCGRCPSGSGRSKGYAGLNVKWTCECGPNCFCFYRSATNNGQLVSTAPTSPAERRFMDLDELRLPASACLLSRSIVATSQLSRANSFESANLSDSERRNIPSAASTEASDIPHDDCHNSPMCHLQTSPLGAYTPTDNFQARLESLPSPYMLSRSYHLCPVKQGSPLSLDTSSFTSLLPFCSQKSLEPNIGHFRCVDRSGVLVNSSPTSRDGDTSANTDGDADLWALVGKCIASDLRLLVERTSDPLCPNDEVASLINYAMQVVAPCVVKCRLDEIGASNVRSVQESLKQFQTISILPQAVKRSTQALILLVTLSLAPTAAGSPCQSHRTTSKHSSVKDSRTSALLSAAERNESLSADAARPLTWCQYLELPKLPPVL